MIDRLHAQTYRERIMHENVSKMLFFSRNDTVVHWYARERYKGIRNDEMNI